MKKYLIYNKNTGQIWRELDQFKVDRDGTIIGGVNGKNNLRYPKESCPAILTTNDKQLKEINFEYDKYKVEDYKVVKIPEEQKTDEKKTK